MKVEFLTEAHYLAFKGEPPPTTIKGVVITDGDNVMAICCLALVDGDNFVICEIDNDVCRRSIIRAWEIFMGIMDRNKTYYALIDRDLQTAELFVKHFGFEPFEDDIYIYRGD